MSLSTAAIVLNWNGAEDTIRCVEALRRSQPAPPHLIVVDNGSTDDSVERIRTALPDVELVTTGRNLGYAGGNNVGILQALQEGAEHVVILNNDVEVDAHCLERLAVAIRAEPSIGAAGPLILVSGTEKRIWAAGGELSHRENISRLRGFGSTLNGRFRSDESVDYLPGCAVMIRREVFDRIGPLDEEFFCYMEDVDYGRRIMEAGFENRFVAGAVAYHAPSSSTGGGYTPARKYMNAVNSVLFLRRHPSLRGWFGFVVFDVLGLPACLLVATLHGRPTAAWAKARGIIDGLRGVPVTPERVQPFLNGHK